MTLCFQSRKAWINNILCRLADLKNSVCSQLSRATTNKMTNKPNDDMCGVLHLIFNMSLKLQRAQTLCKTSCLVPVPKKIHPSTPNDYRLVALTSHIIKTLKRLILKHLCLLVDPWLDPLQFAYRPHISMEHMLAQHVRLKSCCSNSIPSRTGVPQGTVLLPFLFTLYTSDFRHRSAMSPAEIF